MSVSYEASCLVESISPDIVMMPIASWSVSLGLIPMRLAR